MEIIPKYHFYKTKYGDELLIDVVELKDIKKYLFENSLHLLTYFDITLIVEGEGWFRIDNNKYVVKTGDVLFTSPYRYREWSTKNILNGYALIFEKEFLLSFFNDPDFLNNISFFNQIKQGTGRLRLSEDEYLQTNHLISEIRKEILSYTEKDKHILRALLYQTLKYLDRIYRQKNKSDGTITMNRYVLRFMELVNHHVNQHHSVQYYADELCLTPNYLNELVKKETGLSAKQIIRDRLLTEAKKLLLYTKSSVTEIAEKLNFENPSYFIRFFRKHTNTTPLQFRSREKP